MSILRLVSYQCKNNRVHAGAVLSSSGVMDLSSVSLPSSLSAIIEAGDAALSDIRDAIKNPPPHSVRDSCDIRLLAPIPYPRRNLFCVGKNYMDHVTEVAKTSSSEPPALPKYPQFFSKVPECVIGPHEDIPSHKSTTKWLDYEAELAVVIGRKGCDIPKESAMDYVFGYTIANDVSAREVQKRHIQFMKGKCLDKTCPMGPYIVPKGDIDVSDIGIRLWLNGEIRQDSSTSKMIFNVPEIIRQLSQGMTLYPGDIILTGTPSGVGFAMDPPSVLKTGDKIKIEIDGLGCLENSVGA